MSTGGSTMDWDGVDDFVLLSDRAGCFAVPVGAVVEYRSAGAVQRLPAVREEVLGLGEFRDAAIPVVDIRGRSGEERGRSWLVIEYVPGRVAALVIQRVARIVRTFEHAGVELSAEAGDSSGLFPAQIRIREGVVPVFDPRRLFREAVAV